jgi:hypothetical protein
MSPTHQDPIHRVESVSDAAKLDWETKMLREVVDYGARLLEKIINSRTLGHTEACLTVLAGQSIAMTDAIEVLVSAGTAEAARVPARALFEAQLYGQWILAHDTDHRALCWWAHVKRRERNDFASHVANTPEGKAVAQLFLDAGMSEPTTHHPSRQNESITRLAEMDARCEKAPWSSVKETREWYQAAGANSIREVARGAQQEHLYAFFYKPFCRDVHSSNVERWLELGGGKQQVRGVRTLRGIRMLLQFTIPLMFQLYEALIDRFLPSERASYEQARNTWGPCLSKIREPVYAEPYPDPG